ncbi:MAG: hypothetical protein AAGA03_13210, partial [Planctomycetota bacterium]
MDDQPDDEPVLLNVLVFLLRGLTWLSTYHVLRRLLDGGRFTWRLTESHVLSWIAIISIGLAICSPTGGAGITWLAGLAAYRLVELAHILMYFVFVEGGFGRHRPGSNAWTLITMFS